VHPEITTALARQHAAELHATAALHRRRATSRRRRPSPRARIGRALVRWGHRLAPPTPIAPIAPAGRPATTMGA
jgi:hypothetical protein